jgi:hypothetical protein
MGPCAPARLAVKSGARSRVSTPASRSESRTLATS